MFDLFHNRNSNKPTNRKVWKKQKAVIGQTLAIWNWNSESAQETAVWCVYLPLPIRMSSLGKFAGFCLSTCSNARHQRSPHICLIIFLTHHSFTFILSACITHFPFDSQSHLMESVQYRLFPFHSWRKLRSNGLFAPKWQMENTDQVRRKDDPVLLDLREARS